VENVGYLLSAFVIIWAVIFVYIIFMQRKQRKLEREIDMLKKSMTPKQE
jgi:CcmD family protein